MLEIRALGLDGVLEIVPRKFGDERGFFSETYNAQNLLAHGIRLAFVQDNHSYSAAAGTLRGLHYQLPPRAQAKLVRVVRGRAFDVVVDIRKGSPTFAQWIAVELSAERWNQVLVPAGFAHGFVTLEPETEVQYKVSEHYSAEHDRAIRFDDPQIDIRWPVAVDHLLLSAKDRDAPLLADAGLFETRG
ncbi:dTDP-4-dehydrorhamnose 3,5-epimerase [Sinorhizobium mexicanum]|uniref:dTDP-4-dehydrorhamnose 3,5-epimerase n=1 Tax=Sinorhizobium mexicanum TaxID=375549 RepID=A0A859R1I4_9HYPH|nr:dTDP-4-dehydrorhamnose 3,5-epimerase [Sinorhizobium mexicanum]MBP1884564.1 dTDP-4-dehydrorhamnose 3,5-epimerase [Sinorhizobium mexicanum]QLL65469.1 dTDP-4-dehydrorhamnose 3,5-epimerase [Sinorhizobium mexicanum]